MNKTRTAVCKKKIPEQVKADTKFKTVFRCIGWCLLFVALNLLSSVAGFLTELLNSDFLAQAKTVLDDPVEVEKCVDYGLQHSIPIASAILFFLTGLIVFIRRKKEWKQDLLGIKTKISVKEIVKYLVLAVTINAIISFGINFLPETWVASHAESTSYLVSCNFWALLFSAGILSPICEEYFFRGLCVLESSFFYPALITSSILFAITHGSLIQIFYAFIFGIWFSMEDRKKNSILPSIILHIAINSSTIILSRIV